MRRRIILTMVMIIGLVLPGLAASATEKVGGDAPGSWGTRGVSTYDVIGDAGDVSTLATGNCGVRTDMPHPSDTRSAEIHTRVESFCRTGIVSSNSVSATTYRSRWYGWQSQGSNSDGPKATQNLRITVAIGCTVGDRYRYRTNSRGVAVINGVTYSAASYEQNDSEITCKR